MQRAPGATLRQGGVRAGGLGEVPVRVSPPLRPVPSSLRPAGVPGGTLPNGRQVDPVGGSGSTPPSHRGRETGGVQRSPAGGVSATLPPPSCAPGGARGPGELPRVGGVLTHRPRAELGRAQGGGSREASPERAANCSACSTPQVTFHQGDWAKLCWAETALGPLPPQGHQEGAPFTCPCRGLANPRDSWVGLARGRGWRDGAAQQEGTGK